MTDQKKLTRQEFRPVFEKFLADREIIYRYNGANADLMTDNEAALRFLAGSELEWQKVGSHGDEFFYDDDEGQRKVIFVKANPFALSICLAYYEMETGTRVELVEESP